MDNSGYYCDQQPTTFAGGESGDSFYTTAFASRGLSASHEQVILPTAPGVPNEGPSSRVLGLLPAVSWPWVPAWNRLVKTVKTRKKREKTEQKWARYGLKGVKEGS